MVELALFGGEPVRKTPFPSWPVIGIKEKRAVNKVLENGSISSFETMGPKFYGGKYIQKFKKSSCMILCNKSLQKEVLD